MNKGRGFQRGWWLVLITIGVMFTAGVPFVFIEPEEGSFLASVCGELVLIIPVIVGLFMLFWEQPQGGVACSIGFRGFPAVLIPFVILIPMAAQSFAGFLLLPVQSLLRFLFGGEDYSGLTDAENIQGFLGSFMLLCVLAPIFEEILCRGVLMQLFKRYGVVSMLIFSSLGFAMLHLSMQSVIPLFFMGLVLGIIRLTSGSIFASMAAHSACNFYALVMLSLGEVPAWADTLIVVASGALFPILVWFYMKKCNEKVDWKRDIWTAHKPTGISVGFAVCAALFFVVNAAMLISRIASGALFYGINGMTMY